MDAEKIQKLLANSPTRLGMKEILCRKCGEPIGIGFKTNPMNSEFCESCGDECPDCGEFDVLKDGRCFMCNETKI